MTTGTQPPTAPKRSRARTFVPLGIAVWVVLEIWLLLLVADVVGGLTVFFLLVGGLVLGAAVVKRAGRRAFRNLTETVQRQQSGALPAQERESGGNGFLMLSGLLIMLPGLITDAVGLLLLVPPLRSALSRYTERTVERRMGRAAPGTVGDAFQQARMHRPDGRVVQGEVIKNDDRPGPRGDDEGPRPPLTP
ncbi:MULTISPECIES: FxsA family membrane protein [unclassified Streptomyces]|uniref:FxsA family membrane protein n=1 Tax=unclassified Streptomyces TaxID=2593676 RepID=UPI002E1D4EE0|nr:FxsA family protein [Streptomyces sp. NBC_01023]